MNIKYRREDFVGIFCFDVMDNWDILGKIKLDLFCLVLEVFNSLINVRFKLIKIELEKVLFLEVSVNSRRIYR